MEDERTDLVPENGNGGGNNFPPISPALSAPELDDEPSKEIKQELQKRVGRRLSGFAREGYWDEIGPGGITRRQEKSIWAKKAAEEGLIGGARPGAGRPRKNKSVAEVVTEQATQKADVIARELIEMATKHRSPSVKLGAIDRINKFEQDLEKNMRDDEKELRKLSGKSLDAALAEVLAEHGVGYDYEVSQEDVEDA